MHRLVVALSVIVVLLLGAIASVGRGATAQEATPDTAAMMAMAPSGRRSVAVGQRPRQPGHRPLLRRVPC